MRWTPGGKSGDLEDRRGASGFGGRGLGIGLGGVIVLAVLSLVTGHNFLGLLDTGGGAAPTAAAAGPGDTALTTPAEDREVQFVSYVLDDVQHTWEQIFARRGSQYEHARLVLFRDQYGSACGMADAGMGPFYCPPDDKVYLDLGFFDELARRLGAPGDFAQAYVIAHELGHHVQDLLGTDAQVHRLQQSRPDQANELSVRLELQADCYAGVWAHSTSQRDLIDSADVEEALGAAAAVGDDRLQQEQGTGVHPESFTHGTSAQRVKWFRTGMQSGDPAACDTFGGGAS